MNLNISRNNSRKRFGFLRFSYVVAVLLVLASWLFIFVIDKADFTKILSDKNIFFAKKFISQLLGLYEENPAFKNAESWKNALALTYETLQMSVMAIGFATIGMLFTVMLAARNTADGSLVRSKKWYSWLLFGIVRCVYIFSRAVPELIWAMIIIFIFKPGVLPGAIALALHNFGILGKLCAEVIEDLDSGPIRNLASCGAGRGQILIYGILPSVMPKYLTFIMYRWEVIIRTTIVVGFVGAGGLGQHFRLSMSYFNYTEISLLMLCYLILVALMELISEGARRFIR